MRKLFLFTLFITIPIILLCQTDWTLLNSGTTQDLNSIDFSDEDNGLIVGDNGLILRTINGGDTWNIITSGVSNNLNGVSYANADTAIAVGGGPTILRTSDGGVNWEVITVAIYGNLLSVDIDISGNGIAGGTDQTIIKTDDAGATWSITQTGYMGGGWQNAQMLDGSTGFVFGSNSIFQPFVGKTINAGTSFSFYNFYFELGAVSYEGKLYDGYFFDEFNGITAGRRWDGYGCISSTSDLNNWTTQHFTTSFYGINFTSETDGYVVGADGTVMHTTNGGADWGTEDSGVFSQLNSVLFANEDLGFIAGDNGVILKKEESILPPPVNLIAIVIDYNSIIRLEWDGETRSQKMIQRDLLGYNIYFEGVLIANVTGGPFDFYGPFAAGDYYFGVTAVYDEGESELVTVIATVVLNPPENLTATSQGNDVLLTWELPLAGRGIFEYEIYRDQVHIASTTDTLYLDVNISTGDYTYGVLTIFDGGFESEITEISIEHTDSENTLNPVIIQLIGNYPNPFNPETTILFSIAEASSFVTLNIYNIRGEKVKQLIGTQLSTGQHSVIWDGKNSGDKQVSSGIYFYKLVTDDYQNIKKMILIK